MYRGWCAIVWRDLKKIRDELLSEGIHQIMTCPQGNGLFVYRYDDHPASEVSIRGISRIKFQVRSSWLIEPFKGMYRAYEIFQASAYISLCRHLELKLMAWTPAGKKQCRGGRSWWKDGLKNAVRRSNLLSCRDTYRIGCLSSHCYLLIEMLKLNRL
jgi:hypothetical protein